MQVEMHPLIAADKAQVMQIIRSLPEFNSLDAAVAEELADAYLQSGSDSGYYAGVATCGKSVLGYICYGATPITVGTWDIYWAAVRQDVQRQGVGRLMFSFAEENIRRAGGRMILVETSGTPLYERTRAFHESQGYAVVCRIPDFYQPGDDKVVYCKRLEP